MRRLVAERDLHLLPRSALVHTNPLDQADWNYRPLLGRIQRLRLRAVAGALATHGRGRLLEVGYGSGVLLPELRRHCDVLVGIDVHQAGPAVATALAGAGVPAQLATGSAGALPFPDAAFDVVVVVSTLEFVPDVDLAVRELARVTAPRGRLVVVTPGRSRILDAGLRLLTGERAEDTFRGRREQVLPALERRTRVLARRTHPRVVGRLLPLYTVVVAAPR